VKVHRSSTILFLAVVSCLLVISSGCLGRFAMTSAVRKFNLELTDSQWGREITFVALYVIPVYPVCAFGDLFIVNSIEFWTEENPMSGEKAITLSSRLPPVPAEDPTSGVVLAASEDGS